MSNTAAPKFKLKKWHWWVIGIVAVFILGGVGSALGLGGDPEAGPTPSETATASADAIEIPDVAGKPADEARDALTDAGLIATLDGGDSIVVKASNWDVETIDPAAGTKVDAHSVVTLHVVKATERIAQEEAARDAEQAKKDAEHNSAPVDKDTARAVCDARAASEFPYGAKLHWVTGVLAEKQTDDGWFLKVEATVENAYGNKAKGVNIECSVSGTNGAPSMDEFNAY
ncbi:PASTA domain-containing protein [Microbacterium sp. KR10-403]|uniref:PASTA domain-containing protein n=1 Tax=Microbacterium sp. KR10-403 TaxID=3158581 RepID=UPI0032E3BCEC